MAVFTAEPSLLDALDAGAPAPEPAAIGTQVVPPTRRIELAPYDLGAALALERDLGISHVLAQVLVRRGLTSPAQVREFLEPAARHDPAAFTGMPAALATIERHLASGGRVVVHGDYDVDGVCATAVLVRALRRLGAEPGWFIPSRSEDGYGLSRATVERLAARPGPPTLLITVDCGITAVEEIAAAASAGLAVVVTDHHSPRADGQLPDCPIVHPALGDHPFTGLCGTAVAHKLAQALGGAAPDDDLELVALATVADLMPLRDENRRLVRDGLARLAATDRPGLRALLEVSQTDPSALDAGALGFRLAPRINAAGRLRRADAALELLLTDDPERAREIARELNGLNVERRAVEQRITWEAEALVAELGDRPAYVLAADGWHPGVIGIVASRIVERFHRPTILVALDGADPSQPGHGSGRSIPGFDLLGGLHASAEHLDRYGGHRAAAGLTIRPEALPAFRDAFERHAAAVLTPELLTPVERVDAVVSGAECSLDLAEELERLEPCGMGNPGVNLLLAGARFDAVRPMGEEGRHARFIVSSGGARASAVAFGCDGAVGGEGYAGEPLDASFRLGRNVWRGVTEPRLTLRHAVRCAPGSIDVLGEPSDFVAAALDELERTLDGGGQGVAAERTVRTVLDRRNDSPLAVLADARAAGATLAVCADVPRRHPGLAARTGGFALVAHAALAEDPALAAGYEHLVILDPPADRLGDEIVRRGGGFTHLAWGEAELRFAEQMHELEYELRTSLVALYRSLRVRQRVAGEEFGHLLRGDGPQPRSARLAGRLVRVLAELELVSLDRDLPALAIAGAQPTQLDRSAAFRVYRERYEDGQRFLSRARPRRRT